MKSIRIVHGLPAFILVYEDVKKGGQHARVICEFVADEKISARHRSAVCVYSSHVDALIDARIQESMSGIKRHAINLSDFDFSEMYHEESRALPVMLHWCWGAREDRVLYRRNGCLVSVMNCYELPVDQDSMTAQLTTSHEGLKIYHRIRGHTLSDNFLDAIGMSAHTRHGQYDCKRTADEAIKAATYESRPMGEVEQAAYYNSARMKWEFKIMKDELFVLD